MISVLILTKNEEANLPRCLESLAWCDDLVVLDSGSTDRTVEIAKAAGARVYHREFDTERGQRTASLKLEFKHPWVYNPDADEVTPPELRDEMLAVAGDASREAVAYRVRFKTMFMGKWIRRSSLYPTWVVRLFKPAAVSFERDINLRYVIAGKEGTLEGHFIHYTFNKGIAEWFGKHNQYSDMEAVESMRSLAAGRVIWSGLIGSGVVERRRQLKELSFRLPCRPLLRFCYMYFYHLGFLDGAAGFHYCRLLAIYEYMIVLKMKEIRMRERGQAL